MGKAARTQLTPEQREDAARLKVLFNEFWRGTQDEFGAEFDLGTQSNISQYLNAIIPLNLEAAAKFARGLRIDVDQFSPSLARQLPERRAPMLGPREERHLHVLALLSPEDRDTIIRAAEERLRSSMPSPPGEKKRP